MPWTNRSNQDRISQDYRCSPQSRPPSSIHPSTRCISKGLTHASTHAPIQLTRMFKITKVVLNSTRELKTKPWSSIMPELKQSCISHRLSQTLTRFRSSRLKQTSSHYRRTWVSYRSAQLPKPPTSTVPTSPRT